MKQKSFIQVVGFSIVCCLVMALVDGMLRPPYAVKSIIKIAVFLGSAFVLSVRHKTLLCLSLLRFPKKGIPAALALGVFVYLVILGSYFAVKPYFDFSGIAQNLTKKAGVTADNFLPVSLYISFVNSLLEEFFFRGFVFTNLKHLCSRRFAYLFSSALFAAYHVAMMAGWFSPILFLLVMAGLTVGGMLFNYLNERMGTIYLSWLVHMFANFAINTIGFLLLS